MTMGQLECILILQCSLLIALRKRYFCVVEFILNENREEKLLCAMVAKFLDDNKLKMSLKKSEFILIKFVKCWRNCLGFKCWGNCLRKGNSARECKVIPE